MKFFALLVFLLPLAVAAQSVTDYENAMAKFQKFYNTGQGDSIIGMFRHTPLEEKASRDLWNNESSVEALKKYGKLKSFSFVGVDTTDPDNVYVFNTVFSKVGVKNTSLTLYEDLYVGAFRFITGIENKSGILKKSKSSR